MAWVSELKGLVLCHANSPAFFQPATRMEASFQGRLGLWEKRETHIALGWLEMILVLKIMDLLTRNATVTPTLLTLVNSMERVCVCACAPACMCVYFYPLDFKQYKADYILFYHINFSLSICLSPPFSSPPSRPIPPPSLLFPFFLFFFLPNSQRVVFFLWFFGGGLVGGSILGRSEKNKVFIAC